MLERHLLIALKEIGDIEPWWSEEDQMYLFEHLAYPWVMHADPDKEETKAGYLRALQEFIKDRLAGKVAKETDLTTSGRGGRRDGAGRKKGEVTTRVYIPNSALDVINWLKADPSRIEQIRRLMQA